MCCNSIYVLHMNISRVIFSLLGFEKWTALAKDDQIRFVVSLQDDLEVTERERRVKAVQALLYLVQGM